MEEKFNIDLAIDNNLITNIEDIIKVIQESELDFNNIEHLKTLKNRLSSMELDNKNELEAAINAKILEYEMQVQQNTDNATTLKMLQETNEEFKRINIIEVPKEKSDSKKDQDYITLTNDDGSIEVLDCENQNTINAFIQNHKDKMYSSTPEELFRYFKEYIHREMNFQDKTKFDNNDDLKNEAVVREDETVEAEFRVMEEYRDKYTIPGEIEVAIDHNGERIYRLGDGLFKFITVNNERVLETLKTPTINKHYSNEEMLEELENSEDLVVGAPNQNNTNDIVIEKTELKDNETNKNAVNFDNIEPINLEDFNKEDLVAITSKRDVYEEELTYEEEKRLNQYIKFLIEHVNDLIAREAPVDEYYDILRDYITTPRGEKPSLLDVYEDIKNNVIDENELSDLDKRYVEEYKKANELIKELQLNKNKKRELKDEHKNIDTQSGVATLVVIMELISIAALVYMFLCLDI